MTRDIYLLTTTIIFLIRQVSQIYVISNLRRRKIHVGLQDFLASEFAFHDDIFSTRILFSLEMKHFKMRVTTKIHAFLMRAYAFHCSTEKVYEKS